MSDLSDPLAARPDDGPREIIKLALIRSRCSSRHLSDLVNSHLAPDRRRSEKSVSDYVAGNTTPAVDWIVVCEDVLGLERGTLVEGFAARQSPRAGAGTIRTAAAPAPQR
jgi:hypothetical protein